jgi:hypothetical protein
MSASRKLFRKQRTREKIKIDCSNFKLKNVPAELMVAATSDSATVIFIKTHAKFIACGIDTQCALELKSVPRATGIWLSISRRANTQHVRRGRQQRGNRASIGHGLNTSVTDALQVRDSTRTQLSAHLGNRKDEYR